MILFLLSKLHQSKVNIYEGVNVIVGHQGEPAATYQSTGWSDHGEPWTASAQVAGTMSGNSVQRRRHFCAVRNNQQVQRHCPQQGRFTELLAYQTVSKSYGCCINDAEYLYTIVSYSI